MAHLTAVIADSSLIQMAAGCLVQMAAGLWSSAHMFALPLKAAAGESKCARQTYPSLIIGCRWLQHFGEATYRYQIMCGSYSSSGSLGGLDGCYAV